MLNNTYYLEELLRKAQNLIVPTNTINDISYLLKKKCSDKFKKTCFLPIIYNDKKVFILPICNRYGFIDPKIVELTIKLIVMKLTKNKKIDQIQLSLIKNKLERILVKYSKDVPKTKSMAIIKSKSTREFNKELRNNQ